MVKDVKSCNGWDLNNLVTRMPQFVKDVIINTHVHIRDQVPNVLIWEENVHGSYTTKNGYSWILKQRNGGTSLNSWSWIWSMKVPENIKSLVWLDCHESIPTYSLLHHRGLQQSSECQRCLLGEDRFLHFVHDCTLSRQLW